MRRYSLSSAAAGVGHVNLTPDPDGVVRRAPLLIRARGSLWPSLPVRIAMLRRKIPPEQVELHGDHVRLGTLTVPTDESGRMLIRHYGGSTSFPQIPCHQVLSEGLSPGALAGKIALVGVEATAVTDLHPTPHSPAQPGVELNASVLSNLLNGDFLRRECAGRAGRVRRRFG